MTEPPPDPKAPTGPPAPNPPESDGPSNDTSLSAKEDAPVRQEGATTGSTMSSATPPQPPPPPSAVTTAGDSVHAAATATATDSKIDSSAVASEDPKLIENDKSLSPTTTDPPPPGAAAEESVNCKTTLTDPPKPEEPSSAAAVETTAVDATPNTASVREEEEEAAANNDAMMDTMDSQPSTPVIVVRGIRSDATTLEESFDAFVGVKRAVTTRKKTKQQQRTAKPLVIQISGIDNTQPPKTPQVEPTSHSPSPVMEDWSIIMEQEMEDSLRFFQDSHEDQDPSYIQFRQRLQQESFEKQLEQVDAMDQKGRQEIEDVIIAQLQERQASAERGFEKYKLRAAHEEKQAAQKLQLLYRQRTSSNSQKIAQGIRILQRRHQKEVTQAMQAHREQVQQRCVPEQVAASEWNASSQTLQAKHQRQLQEFGAKGDQLKAKTDNDFKREQDKIRAQYESRLNDIESSRKKLFAKLHNGLQLLRQRYLKRHLQGIMKQKEELAQQQAAIVKDDTSTDKDHDATNEDDPDTRTINSPRDLVKLAMEEKAEHRPPSPIKSMLEWAHESPYESAHGAVRHKNRKSVMSQASRQLSVELHNEGLWVALIKPSSEGEDRSRSSGSSSSKKDGSSNETVDQEFIPFGVKASAVLESIVCGEIPNGYEFFDFGESLTHQGGQIRCVVTDLRVSDDTASLQRATAAQEQEEENLAELEKKVNELSKLAAETEKSLNRSEEEEKEAATALETATKDLEKAKLVFDEFLNKFRNFVGPDGNPVASASPKDRQELTKAITRYKSNLETATQREKAAQQTLDDIKGRLQKLQTVAKSAQKNATLATNMLKKKKAAFTASRGGRGARPTKQSEAAEMERASHRVRDVISAFQKAAEKRRDQSNQKKTSSVSSAWIQSFPGLSSSLKKSLWHRIHRRKQHIVLRPTPESLLNELRLSVSEKVVAGQTTGRSSQKRAALEEELLKAEQMFLLATHPVATEELPNAPPSRSNSNWAEPGWQVVLDVPQPEKEVQSILPCAPSYPLLDKNLSEIVSTPGRQAASMVRSSYFRCLEGSLSSFTIASSPAETDSSLKLTRTIAEGDPLNITDEDMSMGYAFALKTPTVKHASQHRKKSATKEQLQPDVLGPEASNKKGTSSVPLASVPPAASYEQDKSAHTERKKPETKKRRSSKAEPSPRARKRSIVVPPSQASDMVAQLSPRNQGAPPPSPRNQGAPPPTQHLPIGAMPLQQSPRARKSQSGRSMEAAAAAAAAAAQYNPFMSMPQQNSPSPRKQSQPQQRYMQPPQQAQTQQVPPLTQQPLQNQGQQQQAQYTQNSMAQMRLPPGNYPPSIQQMQQFYAPLSHPHAQPHGSRQGQFPTMAPMHMQGRPPVQTAQQGMLGSGQQGMPGSGQQGIPGSGQQGMLGSGQQGMPGSGQQGIPGSGQQGMPGSGQQGMPGSAQQGMPGSAQQGMPGSAQQGATGNQQQQHKRSNSKNEGQTNDPLFMLGK